MYDEQKGSEGSIHLPLYAGQPRPCPYLPGRTAEDIFTVVGELDPAVYQGLMDAGFRRSGVVVYRPVCGGCRECVPLRVEAAKFEPSRSQRRVLKRNSDVVVSWDAPRISDEKWKMYAVYLHDQHDRTPSDDYESFRQFLYASPTQTVEMEYRIGGRLAGVGIVDVCPNSLSSVYFYFDPAFRSRSLGTYSALQEIEACRRTGLTFWYAGFYVRECVKMSYKSGFGPFELLGPDGRWVSGEKTSISAPGTDR